MAREEQVILKCKHVGNSCVNCHYSVVTSQLN